MKRCAILCFSAFLFAAVAIPPRLYADAFCAVDPAPYQYQNCGSFAPGNNFGVNSDGLNNGVYAVFQGSHADFADAVIAQVIRNQVVVYTGYESLSNKQLQEGQEIPLIPAGELQAGDQIGFVFDAKDVNGEQLYFSYYYEISNPDHQNHTWASQLSADQCAPGHQGSCLFLGFEDEFCKSGGLCEWGNDSTEADYNDFKMWVYGIDLQPVPEPSSLVLLAGAPLAFAVRKLRNFLK
jgi:hypothetical protein